MDSGRSPPGRPGFQIRPLKDEADIPSGRKEIWLGKDDHKINFQVISSTNITKYKDKIQNIKYIG